MFLPASAMSRALRRGMAAGRRHAAMRSVVLSHSQVMFAGRPVRAVAFFSARPPANEVPTEKPSASMTTVTEGTVAEPEENLTSDSGGEKVLLYPVYSRYDVEDLLQNEDLDHGNAETYARDAAVAMTAPMNLAEIHRLCKEAFGTVQDLQYHNGNTWAPLLIESDVGSLRASLENHPRGGQRIVPIRVPQYFDEFGQSMADPAEEEDDDGENDMESPEPRPGIDHSVRTDPGLVQMSQLVEELLLQLHSPDSPWEMCEGPGQRLRWTIDPTVTLSTREWILGLAQHEPEPDSKKKKTDEEETLTLRQMLYQYPGALDHMANCLHMLDSLPPLPQEEDDAEDTAASDEARQDAAL